MSGMLIALFMTLRSHFTSCQKRSTSLEQVDVMMVDLGDGNKTTGEVVMHCQLPPPRGSNAHDPHHPLICSAMLPKTIPNFFPFSFFASQSASRWAHHPLSFPLKDG